MKKRQDGFTLIEILVVITIIAALVGLVTLLIPEGEAQRKKIQCLNNMRQISGLLVADDSGNKKFRYSGAAFLLQIAPKVKNEQLKVFLCPGETTIPPGRPDAGTDENSAMYRENYKNLAKLDEETLRNMCSYAGPNWKKHPYNPASTESRVWGCDSCYGRTPHHRGIALMWDDGSATFVNIQDLEGQEAEQINVGPGSGDKRLDKMVFYPKQ